VLITDEGKKTRKRGSCVVSGGQPEARIRIKKTKTKRSVMSIWRVFLSD